MTVEAFVDTNEEAQLFHCRYYLYPKQWKKQLPITSKLHSEAGWSDFIKYLSEDGKLSDDIKQLPNDYGGIYVFFIRGMSLPFSEYYLAYVGRAQLSECENLRSRVRSYLAESKKSRGRVKIRRMFLHWKKHLYVRYFKSQDNEFIKQSESALIQAILPPFNTDLTEYKIKEPQKAF